MRYPFDDDPGPRPLDEADTDPDARLDAQRRAYEARHASKAYLASLAQLRAVQPEADDDPWGDRVNPETGCGCDNCLANIGAATTAVRLERERAVRAETRASAYLAARESRPDTEGAWKSAAQLRDLQLRIRFSVIQEDDDA